MPIEPERRYRKTVVSTHCPHKKLIGKLGDLVKRHRRYSGHRGTTRNGA
jgi:hypothetical protein